MTRLAIVAVLWIAASSAAAAITGRIGSEPFRAERALVYADGTVITVFVVEGNATCASFDARAPGTRYVSFFVGEWRARASTRFRAPGFMPEAQRTETSGDVPIATITNGRAVVLRAPRRPGELGRIRLELRGSEVALDGVADAEVCRFHEPSG